MIINVIAFDPTQDSTLAVARAHGWSIGEGRFLYAEFVRYLCTVERLRMKRDSALCNFPVR